MEQGLKDAIAQIVAKDTWTVQDSQALVQQMFRQVDAPTKFAAVAAQIEAANPQPQGAAALKIGIARYLLCRFQPALDVLAQATDNKDRHYFQALCFKALGRYDKAMEELDRAKARGWEAKEILADEAEVAALQGQADQAEAKLAELEKQSPQSADRHYLRGLIDELGGLGEQAADAYEKARAIQPGHTAATFRLAYCLDLHGQEDEAVELYEECCQAPPVFANALLNLSVLHEDAGRYDQAIVCLRRLLACIPNHPRARLFLKDAEASKSMYYDEDQAKRIARRNAVLDIPVTDFELSVRARNCLKKMNIRTLGDLVRTTEADLLGYKNFGETSLKEIKDMLSAKGLRLGQALEEEGDLSDLLAAMTGTVSQDAGVQSIPLEQVELSVRSRKALESLKIHTVGDLANRTEAELLACRNFGQTSLNEVRERLAEYNLRLREPN